MYKLLLRYTVCVARDIGLLAVLWCCGSVLGVGEVNKFSEALTLAQCTLCLSVGMFITKIQYLNKFLFK